MPISVSDIRDVAQKEARKLVEELIRSYVVSGHKAVHESKMDATEVVKWTLVDLERDMLNHLMANSTCLITVAINREIGIELRHKLCVNQGHFIQWFTKEITGILV